MAVNTSRTTAVTIDAPFERVARYLADGSNHPEWGTKFFAGPARPGENGEWIAPVPLMGGDVHYRVDADVEHGLVDVYLAPVGAPLDGEPLPMRVVHNGDGVDVLVTLMRSRTTTDEQWNVEFPRDMEIELQQLKRRLEDS